MAKHNFEQVTPDLRDNILSFYGNLNPPVATKKEKKTWVRTLVELQKLRLHTPDQTAPAPSAGAYVP